MRHPNSERFHQILREAGELHDRKQQDYGRGADPFANIRASAEFGVKPWIGAYIRLNDKIARIKSFIEKGNLANESLEDSLRDVIVYATIALVLYEQEITGTQLHVSTGNESAHSPAPPAPTTQRTSPSPGPHPSAEAPRQGQLAEEELPEGYVSYLGARESVRRMLAPDGEGLEAQNERRRHPKLRLSHADRHSLRTLEHLQSLVPQEEEAKG